MEENEKNQAGDSPPGDLLSREAHLPALVLASSSPRRAEILRRVGWPFEPRAVDVDEARRESEDAESYVKRLAREKAGAAVIHCPSQLVLGADTVVVVDGEILGKPGDEADACRMLRLLNARWHQVLTGVSLCDGRAGRALTAHEVTGVKFATMSEAEINWYVSTGEPMDKAGAYAIQGRGARFIEEIKGDYLNVVGLPVRLLYQLVRQL